LASHKERADGKSLIRVLNALWNLRSNYLFHYVMIVKVALLILMVG